MVFHGKISSTRRAYVYYFRAEGILSCQEILKKCSIPALSAVRICKEAVEKKDQRKRTG